jgi:ABC-type nitrate/sulfonate/bicarbonate transport system permease component
VTDAAPVPDAPPAATVRPDRTGLTPVRLGVLGLVAAAAVVEVVPRSGLLPAEYFPPASRVVVALGRELGRSPFWAALRDTLLTWALGLLIAVAAGVVLGIAIGAVPVLRAATASTVEFLRPIPSVALVPLAVVILGTGIRSTLLLVVYASFWQVLVQVLHGVSDVDPVARQTARSYRLGAPYRLRYLIWPTALPYVITGIRLATSVALVLTITGELIIGSPGLGAEIEVANASGAVPTMYALVVVTGLIGVAANLVTRRAERAALAWHPSVRAEPA